MITANVKYSIDMIKDEARQLVCEGIVCRRQPIYNLCKSIPAREWTFMECELEESGFLFRDPIGDLIGHEKWEND